MDGWLYLPLRAKSCWLEPQSIPIIDVRGEYLSLVVPPRSAHNAMLYEDSMGIFQPIKKTSWNGF